VVEYITDVVTVVVYAVTEEVAVVEVITVLVAVVV
jgi:hypothetical protein